MMSKILNRWFMLLLLCGSMSTMFILAIPNKLQLIQVASKGRLVSVKVERIASFGFGKNKSYSLHFLYQGNSVSAQINREYSEEINGSKYAQLLHLDKFPSIFIAPNNHEGQDIYFAVILIALCLAGVFYSIFNLYKGDF